jgi:hypothetical protein
MWMNVSWETHIEACLRPAASRRHGRSRSTTARAYQGRGTAHRRQYRQAAGITAQAVSWPRRRASVAACRQSRTRPQKTPMIYAIGFVNRLGEVSREEFCALHHHCVVGRQFSPGRRCTRWRETRQNTNNQLSLFQRWIRSLKQVRKKVRPTHLSTSSNFLQT